MPNPLIKGFRHLKVIYNSMTSKLKGKTAWITGGKRIGQVVAKTLAQYGVNIIASYRSSEKEAASIVKEAKKANVKSMSVRMDASNEASVKEAVKTVKKSFKNVDILINMASVFKPVKFEKISKKDWDINFSAHILGTFWPIQIISNIMKKGSHIINISDRTTLGKMYKGYLPYTVTKSAVASLTKASAVELADKGIFINAIAPGPILRPKEIYNAAWQKNRNASALKYKITDNEAVYQFALLVTYLSLNTMSSGYVYPLDQGQNL
jgi:3-oxoacyl-[acyl-carrier protein] reductase